MKTDGNGCFWQPAGVETICEDVTEMAALAKITFPCILAPPAKKPQNKTKLPRPTFAVFRHKQTKKSQTKTNACHIIVLSY